MPQLSEPYVLGLLADLDVEVPVVSKQLVQAKKKVQAVEAELLSLVRRHEASRSTGDEARARAQTAVLRINGTNTRIATLHQEIGFLKKRKDDLKREMARVGPGALHRRLRRELAKLSIRLEDREEEVNAARVDAERLRAKLHEAEAAVEAERGRTRAIANELDELQSHLPSPYLYTSLFDRLVARAHCRLYLDSEPEPWAQELRSSIALMLELHGELRTGKYRLDKHSDIVGGRAMATAEALYGAVAIGDGALCRELFELAVDPSLFFHQIFNVFRVWCLGLYLNGSHTELRDLLRIHQNASGLRGGYVEAFLGVLDADAGRVERGIVAITKHEWEIWQDPQRVRGAGVVNLGAVALTRIAIGLGMLVRRVGPTVPEELVAGTSRH